MELFQVIALLCQVNGTNSSAATVQQVQQQCQKQLVECVESIKSYDTDRYKLSQCIRR